MAKILFLAFVLSMSKALEIPNISTNPLQPYTLRAPNITAKFIPYGARLTSLLVPDRHGKEQDIVLGYDAPEDYVTDTEKMHTYFGAVVGRYANRIKKGTKVDKTLHHVSMNDSQDRHTLHGGKIGYDQRNWTVVDHTESSVTFSLYDDGFEDFPGKVETFATYTVSTNSDGLPQLTTKLVSLSLTQKTPIMLTNHIYWNLDAFLAPTIDDIWLQLPSSHRMVGVDNAEIPTGHILDVATSFNGAADFRKGKLIGKAINKTEGLCGKGCLGYDTCMIIDRPESKPSDLLIPIVRMQSNTTGISMEVSSNQHAVQIYTCNGAGPFPVKHSQVKWNRHGGHKGVEVVKSHGCVAVEPEGWIDGINHPHWGQIQFQIFGPMSRPAVNLAVYTFGTNA